ncbi:hypothetical protein BDR06DRAFT_403021 [Suillus hirtellus]|nr:hypothetical protein BDR06DRAFT_403021 [Suillus hirtellus]
MPRDHEDIFRFRQIEAPSMHRETLFVFSHESCSIHRGSHGRKYDSHLHASIYSQKSYQPACSFHPNTNDQIVAIHVSVTGTMGLTRPIDSRCYIFFMLPSVIVELENLFAETYGQPTLNDPKLLWSTWGPQHTSWFRVQRTKTGGLHSVVSVLLSPSTTLLECHTCPNGYASEFQLTHRSKLSHRRQIRLASSICRRRAD